MPPANLFIAGMPRSGTTSLAFWLDRHPDISLARPKEPSYYVLDLPMRERADSLEQYAATFARATTERYKLDATPWYLYSEAAIRTIARDVPDAQIVVQLRNPGELLPSLHDHHVLKGYEEEEDLATALFAIRPPDSYDFRFALDYVDVGRMGSHVERLLDHFPRGRVHFVDFARMSKTPRVVHLALLEALGLEPIDLPDYRRLNQARSVRSMKVQAVTRRLTSRTSPRVQRAALNRVARLNTVDKKRAVPASVKQRIIDALSDDIDLLAKLTDQNLDDWKLV